MPVKSWLLDRALKNENGMHIPTIILSTGIRYELCKAENDDGNNNDCGNNNNDSTDEISTESSMVDTRFTKSSSAITRRALSTTSLSSDSGNLKCFPGAIFQRLAFQQIQTNFDKLMHISSEQTGFWFQYCCKA